MFVPSSKEIEKLQASEEFKEWERSAKKARERVLKDPSLVQKDSVKKVWKSLKDIFLLVIFHKKCVYCECRVGHGFPYHVDHFRPKGCPTEQRVEVEGHTGYYWLAFEWWNLVPSCNNCNSNAPKCQKSSEDTEGKKQEFRVLGERVFKPLDDSDKWRKQVEDERALLLDPYSCSPEEHFFFDELGMIYGLTANGKETVSVCKLNRADLVDARMSKHRDVLAKIMTELTSGEGKRATPYYSGDEEFSMFCNHLAKKEIENLMPES